MGMQQPGNTGEGAGILGTAASSAEPPCVDGTHNSKRKDLGRVVVVKWARAKN
jgi:hypothetical protein